MLKRHQITAPVTTARVIEVANETIAWLLPEGRSADAAAVSLRDGAILVHCRSASAAQLIVSRERAVLDMVKKKLPTAKVDRIKTRVGV
jgi:hypothetical protein